MTKVPVVAVTDTAIADDDAERQLAAEFGAQYRHSDDGVPIESVLEEADVVFTNFRPLTRTQLARLAEGAVVVRYGVGVDNIDLGAASDLGIRVANVPDYGANVVADHTVMLIGALQRRIVNLASRMRAGEVIGPDDLGPIRSFEATTVGLIGAGRIARLVATRLQAFGCRVLAHDPYADEGFLTDLGIDLVSYEVLLGSSHVVSVHAPLTDATRHLLDDDAFAAMRPQAALVNTSRGGLVDTEALLRALDTGRLVGAALDVTDPEPLPAQSPLRSRREVILTPHVAFYSEESMTRLQHLAVDEGRRALRGEDLRCPVPLPSRSRQRSAHSGPTPAGRGGSQGGDHPKAIPAVDRFGR